MSLSALTSLDYICILICLFSGIAGYKRGAINTLISFGGFIASFVMAWIFSPLLANWMIQTGLLNGLFETINIETVSQSLLDLSAQQSGLTTALLGEAVMNGGQSLIDQSLTAVTALITYGIAQSISFGVIVIGVSVLSWILQIIFLGVSKIPVIGTINRLAGMLIGLLLGGTIIAVGLWVFSVINFSTGGVANLPTGQNSYLIQIGLPIVLNYIKIQ
ncbi:CvpA family protein [uncultured Acetobacterium sp.]|uniref:CvpA family protein n=1 Tax=uncultured Acetobacterium sp. TaxID=217139 RepID=UPI0025D36370|nr:CvpA family protein [uncultured Acetobacterium sp.]MDP2842732.1 CvpA family protein [Acetobacterium sp.]